MRPSTTPSATGRSSASSAPSGVGKSQLARIIAGLQRPTAGHVLVGPEQAPVEPGMVGVVPQNYRLFGHRTVLGNLMVAAAHRRTTPRPTRDNCHAWAMHELGRFGMEACANLYPGQLSGGQRQRVAIAQQLLCSEHFLIMDEPLSGLDPIMVDTVCALIANVAAAHELNTLLVVTHDIRSALKVADWLWVMGRETHEDGTRTARIVATYDLDERGLAWRPDVSRLPEFVELEREVRDRFKVL